MVVESSKTPQPGRAMEVPTAVADAADVANQAPEAERIVSDVETLKALSDPLRLKVLEVMVARTEQPWSAKELAAELDVPQTRLYHHIDLLLERDLIRVASQRLVSGILETRYRVAALSLRLDRKLLAGGDPEAEAGTSAVLAAVLDSARAELEVALREAASVPEGMDAVDRPWVTRGLAKLTPERAGELRKRIEALLAEFEADAETADSRPYSLLIALYAAPSTLQESNRG